jgi:hypothetical protein
MRIDSSGNVGIGRTNPGFKLDVTDSNLTVAKFETTSAGSYGLLRIQNTNTDGEASIGFRDSSDSDATSWVIGKSVGATDALGFYYGSTRMIIDSSGNLLVGSTSAGWNPSGGGAIQFKGITSHAGIAGAFQSNGFNFEWTGSPALWVDATNLGNIQLSSDYRIKRNIETQTAPALERIMALRPVTYQMADFKDGLFKAGEEVKEGFIAHEVQEVIPSGAEGVKDDETQIQSLRVDAILAVAVKAIQELNAEVQALKKQLGK